MKNKNCLCAYESLQTPHEEGKPVLNTVHLSNKQLSCDP